MDADLEAAGIYRNKMDIPMQKASEDKDKFLKFVNTRITVAPFNKRAVSFGTQTTIQDAQAAFKYLKEKQTVQEFYEDPKGATSALISLLTASITTGWTPLCEPGFKNIPEEHMPGCACAKPIMYIEEEGSFGEPPTKISKRWRKKKSGRMCTMCNENESVRRFITFCAPCGSTLKRIVLKFMAEKGEDEQTIENLIEYARTCSCGNKSKSGHEVLKNSHCGRCYILNHLDEHVEKFVMSILNKPKVGDCIHDEDALEGLLALQRYD